MFSTEKERSRVLLVVQFFKRAKYKPLLESVLLSRPEHNENVWFVRAALRVQFKPHKLQLMIFRHFQYYFKFCQVDNRNAFRWLFKSFFYYDFIICYCFKSVLRERRVAHCFIAATFLFCTIKTDYTLVAWYSK